MKKESKLIYWFALKKTAKLFQGPETTPLHQRYNKTKYFFVLSINVLFIDALDVTINKKCPF